MNEQEIKFAEAYDRLEALHQSGTPPEEVKDAEMADFLRVVDLLDLEGQKAQAMPNAPEFTATVIERVKPRHFYRWTAGLAVAAAFLVAFLLIKPIQEAPPPEEQHTMVIDPGLLEQASRKQMREAMVEYMQNTERLLVAMRDYEIACSEQQADMTPEKILASQLLRKQKHFSPDMNLPEFIQARDLFVQLESILVNVNSLDSCSDPMEVDFINKAINSKRIIGKLRLMVQEFQVS